VNAAILTVPQADRLLARVKAQFYPDRSYPGLLEQARAELGEKDCECLRSWLSLPGNAIDQKRLDALELLRVVADFRERNPEPVRPRWSFQHTDAWEQVRRTIAEGRKALASASHGAVSALPVSEPAPPEELVLRARLRALEVRAARADGYKPSASDISFVTGAFCRARGLADEEALRTFLTENDLTPSEFQRLMEDEASAQRARMVPEYDLARELRDLALLELEVSRRP
jgi:hypothetical protein